MSGTWERIYVWTYLGKDCQGGTFAYTWNCLEILHLFFKLLVADFSHFFNAFVLVVLQ